MSSSAAFSSPDHQYHLSPSSEKLCYVHCDFCDTVLAVSVPCSSLYMTVTVRCGHCTNLLSVNMRALQLPSSTNQLHQLGHSNNFFSPQINLMEEIRSSPSNMFLMNQSNPNESPMPVRGAGELPRLPATNKAPEKRQRVPSAYNRFIKEEIQRIKAGNPDISHREAFSAAAKNWAHFPHIHFGRLPDQSVKKPNVCQQDGSDDAAKNDGFRAAASVGISPYN
ncbi:hypothetical protein DCAR_0209651 [Daucus carota subsp. sativus]|uniref:Uncharacterized protein n=1 Tax=Daucus carota subsp. sativus TaxID=79200 RepID=A0AAF1ARN7_DAUCS|nr:PREDICTED: axial regulator YABBY 1-like [Daucus carota subsp. sativus]WOG90407.1 hypothetical protein DCAR_0209651 [Daucus carota subsp. sativus]